METLSHTKEIQQKCITQACPPMQDVSSSSSLHKYNLGFHLKTLISKSPSDETLTLVFKMLQKTQETLVTPSEREQEIKYIRRSKREKRSGVLLLITSLHKNEQE